jgi:hypothetical protein
MAIQQDGLHFRQKRIIAVDVRPAGLHHANPRVGEVMDGALQEIRGRNKVGIEDGDEFTFRGFQAVRQSTCLKSLPVTAMMIRDRKSFGSVVIDQSPRHRDGFISRIVQYLDVEFLQGIIKAANGIQQSFHYKLLVADQKICAPALRCGSPCSCNTDTPECNDARHTRPEGSARQNKG